MNTAEQWETLLSLPPAMAAAFEQCETRWASRAFATCDPAGQRVGSGGGTAHVLAEAWRADPRGLSFENWLRQSGKFVVHGGGESRRLPAYASAGKLFIPVPAYRWTRGHRVNQALLDLQMPFLRVVSQHAADSSRVLIASGDVLLRNEAEFARLPDADVVLLGLWTTPEQARHFGVMFTDHDRPETLVTFLQKPAPDRVREMAGDYLFLVDVGAWLLSERAVMCLMRRCGWNSEAQEFERSVPAAYDLYGNWALHLGSKPAVPDPEVSELTVAVVPVPRGSFYHFGRSRDVIDSVYRLQNLVIDQMQIGALGRQPHPRQFCQNSIFQFPLRHDANHTLWVENSHVPASWELASEHVLTGVPENDWDLKLEAGVCLDFVPIEGGAVAVRAYGLDDPFRGTVGDPATTWFGRPAENWFTARDISLSGSMDSGSDIQNAPLFPAMSRDEITPRFVEWLFAAQPAAQPEFAQRWRSLPRFSAAELAERIDLPTLYDLRRQRLAQALPVMARNYERSIFYKLDLDSTAGLLAQNRSELPHAPVPYCNRDPLVAIHDRMLRAAVSRKRNDIATAESLEEEAFAFLRRSIVDPIQQKAVEPSCCVLGDQIVWGRSPVRLDVAGGWTDTPPYCLEQGGQVVNLAVDLNGQPPIQIFVRMTENPELVVRSIDLGLAERLGSYEDVRAYDQLQSGFTVARAAFALAGFDPDFNGGRYDSLADQLRHFGGGVEVSMLAAVPKGSGLGTSSILAATLLGALSDFCGLGWDSLDIMQRTLALEQMLTSGGGWQDQAGGLFHGAKLVETAPGLTQRPVIRWLPDRFFTQGLLHERMLLYYTGVTRVARSILAEIVRGIFLNASACLATLDEIRHTARFVYDAVQRDDVEGFVEAVDRSWVLNQRLDSGTNVPAVQEIIERCGRDLAACKLLGAGGGGYLFMVADSAESAAAIRQRLTDYPPNKLARFVDFSLSSTGLQITRS